MRLTISALQCLSALRAVSTVARGGPVSPGTRRAELRVPVQHPTAGESLPPLQRRARQRSLLATRPICPRHALGTEDAHASARPGEGSHAGDPLLALNTDTEVKRKQINYKRGRQPRERRAAGARAEAGGCHPGAGCEARAGPQHPGLHTPPQPRQRDRGAGTPLITRGAEYKAHRSHPEPKSPSTGLCGHARGRGQRRAGLRATEQRVRPPGTAGAAAHPGVLPLSC